MSRRTRARAFALVILLAAQGVVQAGPSAPTAAGKGTGGTTITVAGSVVTLTVHIDFCCLSDPSERLVYAPFIDEGTRAAEDQWNTALAKLPAKGCYTIRLVIVSDLLSSPSGAHASYDQVTLGLGSGRSGWGQDPYAPDDHNADTTSAFDLPLKATFFINDMTDRSWAHEIGHALGLGDDYADNVLGGHGISQPLPGREGTLMDTGTAIDQNLADRVAGLVTKDGTKLPTCWRATMQTHSEYHTTNPEYLVCITEWKFVLNFPVASDGSLSGSGVADLQSVGECHPYSTVIGKEIPFAVSGRMTTHGFTITVTPTGLPQPSGSVDITGMVSSLSGVMGGSPIMLEVPFTDASHTMAKSAFSRKAADAANIYTTQSSIVIVPAP